MFRHQKLSQGQWDIPHRADSLGTLHGADVGHFIDALEKKAQPKPAERSQDPSATWSEFNRKSLESLAIKLCDESYKSCLAA